VSSKKTEVIVVGAGSCGSFTALTLGKLGTEVVVFEEHEEIGVPSHCAGHVSLNGLKHLMLHIPSKLLENKIYGARFHSPSGLKFEVKCSSPVTCVLNRELLDKHLAKLAEKAGVEYVTGIKVHSLVLRSGGVAGVVTEGGETRERVTSNLVVNAEGCSSLLLKKIGMQTLNRSMVVNAIQTEINHVDDVNPQMVEVYLGRKYAPGFFAWIIPKKDGSAKIGLATKTGDPREYLRRFMRKHPVASKKLQKGRVTGYSMHPISLGGPIPKTYLSGLLIVGDAASQVKPTTGGGIIFGLLCARIAAETAYQAIRKNDFSERFLSRYQARWRKAIGFELNTMLRLRKWLNRLSDAQIDKIIGLCDRFGIAEILEKTGDVDYEGSSLLHMVPHPAVSVAALYFLVCSLTSPSNQ
jgi:geranylgeranyl reductase family protein